MIPRRIQRGNRPLVIELARTAVRALEAERRGDGLRLSRTLVEEIPRDISASDPSALGGWLGDELRRAGFAAGRACFTVSREHISLKRLTLPTTDPYELPEMVRLSMQRELPFDPAHAVIDFIEVASDEHYTTVLVAAMRQETIEHIQRVARAAGLSAGRIALRCSGVAALLNTLRGDAADDSAAILGIDIVPAGVEFSVVTDGHIRFSRAAEIADVADDEQFIEAVVTETRRSWMSYRIVEDAPPISASYLLGEERIAREIARRAGELMTIRAGVVADHPRINAQGQELGTTWPLAGLLLEEALGWPSFDFAHPRKAPDRHARVRQMVLAAIGVIIIALATGASLAWRDLQQLEAERDRLEAQVREGADDFYRATRDQVRLEHLENWNATTVAWLDHLLRLENHLPDSSQLVLDEWSGSLIYQRIEYDRTRPRDQRWIVPAEVVMTLDGEAASREIVDQLRNSLARSEEYTTSTSGPDTEGGKRYPFPFKLTLRTRELRPAIAKSGGVQEESM